MAALNLTMVEAAEAAGLSYDWFRKVWPRLCEEEGFPAPVHRRTWDAQAVADWRRARSERRVVVLQPRPRVETPPASPADLGRRARAALQQLKAG